MNNKIFMKQYIITLLLLLMVGAGKTYATDYVIKTNNDKLYVCIDNSGVLGTTSTFDPTTCIWTGTLGTTGKETTGTGLQCNGHYLGCSKDDADDVNSIYTPVADGEYWKYLSMGGSSEGLYCYPSVSGSTSYTGGRFYYYKYKTDGSGLEFTYGWDATVKPYLFKAVDVSTYLKNELSLSVTNPKEDGSSYIASVGGTLEINASLTGSVYYYIDKTYYTLGWEKSDTKPTITPKLGYKLSSGSSYASRSGTTVTYKTDPGFDVVAAVTVTGYPEGYSSLSTSVTQSFTLYTATLAAPTITRITNTNLYQITGPINSTIQYSIDGTEIASQSDGTTYTSVVEVTTAGTVIKARAFRNGNASTQTSYTVTDIISNPSGVTGGTVTLNDLEDHTWTYYTGVDDDYRTNYGWTTMTNNDKYTLLYSPNPRNVKITYDGNGGAVSIDESETKFIYYETLEENGASSGEYDYQVISNPFSKRPTRTDGDGNKVYQGFNGWKITKGWSHIKRENGNIATQDEVLNLDENIKIVDLNNDYTPNCISAEIELQATWVDATVLSGMSNIGKFPSNGTYETNLFVIKLNTSSDISPTVPMTIMMVEPDGSADYRTEKAITAKITPANFKETGKTTKIEFAHWKPGSEIDLLGRNFIIGRGMTMDGTAQTLNGCATDTKVNQILKIESGTFSYFYNFGKSRTYTSGNVTKQWVTFGNDYDRAKRDNSQLKFTSSMSVGENGTNVNAASGYEVCRIYSKSGTFLSKQTSPGNVVASDSYYLGFQSNTPGPGSRYFELQGGEWWSIVGGMGGEQDGKPGNLANDMYIDFRMKGGTVKGCVYGAAVEAEAGGIRKLVFTGGTVNGWIAGGANGQKTTGGHLNGDTYLYIGGNTVVKPRSLSDDPEIGYCATQGGNIFGAGCGNSSATGSTATVGQVNNSNVVIADNASISRNVYGGGNYGYVVSGTGYGSTKIYIAGGDVQGKVFGGSNKQQGQEIKITMTGGLVESGLYGGSNTSGTINNNVTVNITGGQVGTSDATANVHGGGYGSSTAVKGNVDVTFGGTATVYGNVYGGGADGKTNTTNTAVASITKHTNVNMTGGTINGSLFGAGKGESAASIMNPVVTMSGGTVTQNIFGGGDAAKVDGNTSVTITGPSHVGNNVYGGGNAAEVSGTTHVQIGEPK